VLICGDLNSGPGSAVCRQFKGRLRDIQDHLVAHKPMGTFTSPFPLHRIDHIFMSEHFDVKSIRVPHTRLARISSDHLPLITDLVLS
jgi:endonuclease/exonuclease/phosphatase family metal-dependent hydrolase